MIFDQENTLCSNCTIFFSKCVNMEKVSWLSEWIIFVSWMRATSGEFPTG
jgi:hypothetical protein